MAKLTLPKLERHLYAAAENPRNYKGFFVPARALWKHIHEDLHAIHSEELQLAKLQSLKRDLAHDLLTGRVRVKTGDEAK